MDVDTKLLINLDRGQRNEQRVITILQGYTLPAWINGFRRSTIEQDIRGIDLIISVKLRNGYLNVPFQIKSSDRSVYAAAKKFEAKGYNDLVKFLVVNERRTDRDIFDDIITQLNDARHKRHNYQLFYRFLGAPLTYLEMEMKKGILRQQAVLASIGTFSDEGRFTVAKRPSSPEAANSVSAHVE